MRSETPARHRVVMVDVARHAGVSQKTVSRVVNDAPYVRPEVRQRVLGVIEALGYRPNGAARALATQRTYVIGVLALGVPLFGPAHRIFSLEHAARQRGYELAVASLGESSPGEFRAALSRLLARGIEGLVLELPNDLVDLEVLAFSDLPVVTGVEGLHGVERQTVVSADQVRAGALATQHLLELGHRTVWHIAGPLDWAAARQRAEGWGAALRAANRPEPPVLQGDWSAQSGYRLGLELAARGDVTAVFSANDHQAMGVMRAFAEQGWSIPADVSVVGFDDVPEAEYQMVPLTTVRVDHTTASHRTLTELVALIGGAEPAAERVDIPCELLVRKSTGPARRERTPTS